MMTEQTIEIVARLREILRRRGLSQREFARLTGKTEAEVSRWLSGSMGISKANIRKLEAVLNEPLTADSTFVSEIKTLRIGMIGTGSIASRFVQEVPHVSDCVVTAVYNPYLVETIEFCKRYEISKIANTLQELFEVSDAIYVASPIATHYEYAKKALENGKHVICEMPFTQTMQEAEELYDIARRSNLVLLPALKTAYCPSFIQLIDIVESGEIGQLIDVTATVTQLLPPQTSLEFSNERLLENSTYVLLAAFKLFGSQYKKVHVHTVYEQKDGVATESQTPSGAKAIYSHIILEYGDRTASLKTGVGVKSEGSLVISGTKGYVYIPAPWWKTDYFEVRYENQNDNKKYFFPYESSGLRYEIEAFRNAVMNKSRFRVRLTREENLKMIKIQSMIVNS